MYLALKSFWAEILWLWYSFVTFLKTTEAAAKNKAEYKY